MWTVNLHANFILSSPVVYPLLHENVNYDAYKEKKKKADRTADSKAELLHSLFSIIGVIRLFSMPFINKTDVLSISAEL